MGSYRILIVDDEYDVRSVVAATLRPLYEIVEAHDGLDALEKMERAEPDFVLLDVMMPLMDGYQTCEAIRKNERFRDVPVMFLSALGTKDDIRKGYSTGANLYLTKPFEPARLLRNIQLFFETNPPRSGAKRYTLKQLAELDRAPADIHEADTVFDKTPVPVDAAPAVAPGPPVIAVAPPAPPAPVRVEVGAVAAEESAAVAPEASARPAYASGAPGLRPRIMIVDDDDAVLDLFGMALGDLYEVTLAKDGLQAIERIVRHQPDLVMVDIMLPKMNGFQLCQSLRANKSFSKTPIVICSAKSGERDIAYAKRVGANDYLVKPFTQSELLGKVDGILRAPGFFVRPKSLPYSQVLHEIKPQEVQDNAFHADSDVRKAMVSEEKSEDAIKKFLKKEASKEAFEHAEEPKKKKGLRLWGFGKDKSS